MIPTTRELSDYIVFDRKAKAAADIDRFYPYLPPGEKLRQARNAEVGRLQATVEYLIGFLDDDQRELLADAEGCFGTESDEVPK